MSRVGIGMPDGSGVPDGRDRHGDEPVSNPLARLKVRPDFLRASSGARVHGRSLSLQVYRRGEADPLEECRVGLTVTKKVGNAVERNRVKRRFRAALRSPALPTKADHDYVIVARRDALSTRFDKLVGELRRCFGDAASGRSKAARPRGPVGAGPRRGRSAPAPVPSK